MKNAGPILTALNEPIFELDLDGVVISTTAAADALAGKDIGTIGYALPELINPADKSRFTQSLKRVAEGKIGSTTVEALMPSAMASEINVPMEFKLVALTGVNGKPTGIAAWVRDLSLEKANETAANVQGTHLLDLVENVSDACVVEGPDGTVEMMNNAFCKLFNIVEAPQSMVGTGCAELFEAASLATERRIGPLYFPLDASGDSNQHDQLDFQLATGETVVQASLAVDGATGIAGRMHLFHLKIARASAAGDDGKSASGLVAAQMTLIEKIAHELVVALEGAGSAVLRGEQLELPSQLLGQFRRVENAASTAFDSIAGLLDFSRIEGTQIVLEPTAFRLRENIAALIASVAPHAENLNVQLRVRIEQDVPNRMAGDGARLMLALRNLIDCALAGVSVDSAAGDKPSEITLTISPEYAEQQKIYLAFSIEHINRGAAKNKTLPPSAIMRLAMARQIVRALANEKSKIEVTERKQGITYAFTSDFPFDANTPPAPRPTFVTLTGLPALIVSHNVEERKQLAEWLKGWRMHPYEADNATMAIELLTRMAKADKPIPLVITSNVLPVQDGFLLAFRIKQHPQHHLTAIIMLAATGKPGDAITCRENGISAYLRQPIAQQQLNEAIVAIMGSKDDNDTDATLITRHSLRESKKASVLIIDAARDQVMFAAGTLKKRDYRVVIVVSAAEAFDAMAEEEFDVIVVDPTNAKFADEAKVVEAIKEKVGADRPVPKILCACESAMIGPTAYDGMVLKPFAKESLINAVSGVLSHL